eukprot:COSAG02_NODE_15126_length_1201_cov_2.141561_1_plen_279_part_10
MGLRRARCPRSQVGTIRRRELPASRPAFAAGMSGPSAAAGVHSHNQLMQLVPLFEETKQFLRNVETNDSSTPRIDSNASYAVAGKSGRNQLMQLVPLFEETKQFLRKVETVDKSVPQLDASADDNAGFVPPAAQQQLMQLVPLFEETKQFLRKVETVDKSVPRLANWGAEASTPPPLPSGRRSPPSRAPPLPAAASYSAPAGTESHNQLMQLVPLFEETKQFLRKVETNDSSTPRIDSNASYSMDARGGRNQLMQLVPLFEETKQFLRKVECVWCRHSR